MINSTDAVHLRRNLQMAGVVVSSSKTLRKPATRRGRVRSRGTKLCLAKCARKGTVLLVVARRKGHRHYRIKTTEKQHCCGDSKSAQDAREGSKGGQC